MDLLDNIKIARSGQKLFSIPVIISLVDDLDVKNKKYWQDYESGKIPSTPKYPPKKLLSGISGPILDTGTGDGKLAEKLSEKGYEVYAIDIAEKIIKENLKRSSKVKYFVEDITKKTHFPDSFFGLIIFKFTLTIVHKGSWQSLGNEVYRLLKPGGKVWFLEPLVSESYNKRYELSSGHFDDEHVIFVFKDKDMAEKVMSKKDLEDAIKKNKVSRIVKHYTLKELKDIFRKLRLSDHSVYETKSPSGYAINTIEAVFGKN